MKQILLGGSEMPVPQVITGCMRWRNMTPAEAVRLIRTSLEYGANYFDHADIYGTEALFGQALQLDDSIQREQLILQSKCGIRPGVCYDLSRDYILAAVDGILQRLHTDYLDVLLLHRPDALVEPEEVAEAFDILHQTGKVRHFGVSNHKPAQIELLKKYVRQPLLIDQMQFSLPVSNMVANGMEVNMETPGSVDHDDSVLDYCRLHDITVQAWSPFQMPNWGGCWVGSEKYAALNAATHALAEKYGVSDMAIAAAWTLRHPAKIQIVAGTANAAHLKEIFDGTNITLTREEWYQLYLAAGHILP